MTRYKITCTETRYWVIEGNEEQAVEEFTTINPEDMHVVTDLKWDITLLAPLDPITTDRVCEYVPPKASVGDPNQVAMPFEVDKET